MASGILPRVIPTLLLQNRRLVKTTQFADPVYIGDPVNTVKIFNDKEVDELVLLDILATPEERAPQFEFLADIASESFVPLAYGGGVRDETTAARLFTLGIEKVILNSAAVERPELIRELADVYGSQAVVVSIDVRTSLFGDYAIFHHAGRQKARGLGLDDHVRRVQELGAGEIIITSIDREGTMNGFDIGLIKRVAALSKVPVIACGGAGGVADFTCAVSEGGASAVGAGSLFVYNGPLHGVLINYPTRDEIGKAFGA